MSIQGFNFIEVIATDNPLYVTERKTQFTEKTKFAEASKVALLHNNDIGSRHRRQALINQSRHKNEECVSLHLTISLIYLPCKTF